MQQAGRAGRGGGRGAGSTSATCSTQGAQQQLPSGTRGAVAGNNTDAGGASSQRHAAAAGGCWSLPAQGRLDGRNEGHIRGRHGKAAQRPGRRPRQLLPLHAPHLPLPAPALCGANNTGAGGGGCQQQSATWHTMVHTPPPCHSLTIQRHEQVEGVVGVRRKGQGAQVGLPHLQAGGQRGPVWGMPTMLRSAHSLGDA